MSDNGFASIKEASSSRAAAWLAQRSPDEVNQAAVLMAKEHGITLNVPQTMTDLRVVTFMGYETVFGDGDFAAASEELRKLLTPASKKEIEAYLAELSVITARRQADEFEERLRLRAYVVRLSRFPADVARHALLVHAWHYWPTWAELEKVCSVKVAPRWRMIRALEREIGKEPPIVRADAEDWEAVRLSSDQREHECRLWDRHFKI